jgi:hypothetical protein
MGEFATEAQRRRGKKFIYKENRKSFNIERGGLGSVGGFAING